MKEIYLKIAGFNIKINLITRAGEGAIKRYAKKRFIEEFTPYFKPFMMPKKVAKWDFIIDIDSDYNPIDSSWHYEGKTYVVMFKKLSEKRIVSYYQISMYQLRLVFLYVLSLLLSKNAGFSLHCSAILNGDSVDLFLGKSGAGKSTISSFLERDFIKLSDEVSFVKKENSEFYFQEGPEIDKQWKGRKPGKYNINRIYFLKKSKAFQIEKINKSNAVKFMLEDNSNINIKNSLKYMMEFIKEFDNFYTLSFPKDKEGLIKFYRSIK